jgi:hypothetical protein
VTIIGDVRKGVISGTRACRRGHPIHSAEDYWVDGDGRRRCKECREGYRRLVERKCASKDCETIIKGTHKHYCEPCRERAKQPSKNDKRTRKCEACRRRKPLREFIVRGVGSTYRKTCDGCEQGGGPEGTANPNSPYELARKEIVEKYGVPSREWMNRRDHPLNQLHLHRMISINNSGKGTVKVRAETTGEFSLLSVYRKVKAAGFVPLKYQAQGKTRAATAVRQAVTHTHDQLREAISA